MSHPQAAASMHSEARRVDVIDDDPEFRQSLAWILQSVGYTVETFASADDFLIRQHHGNASVALIDLLLPGMTGLALCREILTRRMPIAFILISGHADVPSAIEAIRLGATDLLEKPFSSQKLLDVVDKAQQAACLKQKQWEEEQQADRRVQELSPRERDVFQAMAAGMVTKEIAKRLGISGRTVDVHRSRIMYKLGVRSPLQIAALLTILQRKTQRELPDVGSARLAATHPASELARPMG